MMKRMTIGFLVFPVIACLLHVAPVLAEAEVYIYPKDGQSAEQQSKDKYECYEWAKQQTGFDPQQAANVYQADPNAGRGSMVGGAARGAALGAVVGAVAGNAGKGAAIGAAGGGTAGLMRRGGAQRREQDKESQAKANHQAQSQNYDRAFATCMGGRGYTVN